jgi:hypothetical protein
MTLKQHPLCPKVPPTRSGAPVPGPASGRRRGDAVGRSRDASAVAVHLCCMYYVYEICLHMAAQSTAGGTCSLSFSARSVCSARTDAVAAAVSSPSCAICRRSASHRSRAASPRPREPAALDATRVGRWVRGRSADTRQIRHGATVSSRYSSQHHPAHLPIFRTPRPSITDHPPPFLTSCSHTYVHLGLQCGVQGVLLRGTHLSRGRLLSKLREDLGALLERLVQLAEARVVRSHLP